LTKQEVEELLTDYDIEPLVALTRVVRRLVGRADDEWPDLVWHIPNISDEERAALAMGEQDALDRLAARLNEERELR
jgi:hypothetical protein